jgi:hypothetical protein
MSTSPERIRLSDHLVTAIARWLANHIPDDELREELDAVDLADCTPAQAEALLELQNELDVSTDRAAVEVVAREALSAVALCT